MSTRPTTDLTPETPDPYAVLIAKWRAEYQVALDHDKLHGLRDTTIELGGKVIAADELAALRRQLAETKG